MRHDGHVSLLILSKKRLVTLWIRCRLTSDANEAEVVMNCALDRNGDVLDRQ